MKPKYSFYLLEFFCFAVLIGIVAAMFKNDFPSSSSLNQEIDSYLKEKQFQGSALIAHKGKILFEKSYGLANAEHQIPNTPQTVFRIGSITKLFTAVVILQLQEQGLLKVSDTIAKYIPDYPQGDRISIHHLLSHTSGIASITRLPNLLEIQRQATTPLKAMDHFKDLPLKFTPGTDTESSDSNYIILGAIIENVTQKPYEEVLKENILIPLHMTSTYYEYNHYVIPHRASGYQYQEGKLSRAPFIDMSLPHAAGALSSTVEDLYRLDQALKGTSFISKEIRDALFTIHGSNATNKLASGYGFRIGPLNRGMEGCEASIAGHFATIDGFEGAMITYQKDDLTIILLSNVEKSDLRSFHKEIASLIRASWRSSL